MGHPRGWARITIEELVDRLQYGYTAKADHDVGARGPAFLRITDIADGGVNWSSVPHCRLGPEELAGYKLEDGDLLFARTGSIEKACLIKRPPEAVFASYLIRGRPVDGRTGPWLGAFVGSFLYRNQALAASAGIGRANINAKSLGRITLLFPPLSEQHRILSVIESYFTRLDNAVATLERAQRNLKRYRASVLKAAVEGRLVPTRPELASADGTWVEPPATSPTQSSQNTRKRRAGRLWGGGVVPELTTEEKLRLPVGWRWVKVRELGDDPDEVVQVGPMSMRSSQFEQDGVPVLNVGCVQWDRFDESKLNYLPADRAEHFSRYRIRSGDVLFTRSGTVGRCAVAQARQDGWLMTFHLLRARTNPSVCLPEYLRIVLEGAPHIRRQTKGASIGTTRSGFNTNLLAGLDIPLPPIPEQRRIINAALSLLSVVDVVREELAADRVRIARLRQSILKWAFEGRLVDQDPTDEPASVLLESIRAERESARRSKSRASARRGTRRPGVSQEEREQPA